MKLDEAIEDMIRKSDVNNVVFAKKPWGFESEAIIGALDINDRVPQDIKDAGYEYFLEGEIINDLIQAIASKSFGSLKLIEFIIFYAENDAYPEWVNN